MSYRWEPVMLALALLVIPVVLVEESHASSRVKAAAGVANWAIWLGFVAELVFVLAVARRKRAAVRAHWLEIAVVIATPPFLPRVLGSLRLARLTRLLRLMRLGMLGTRAIRTERVLTTRTGFRYLALLTAFLVAIAGAVISVVDAHEFPTVGTGMWWAIVTVTTVGYGDYAPQTTAGRIVGALPMLIGIGFLSLLTATIASTFVAADEQRAEDQMRDLGAMLERIEQRLERIETTRS